MTNPVYVNINNIFMEDNYTLQNKNINEKSDFFFLQFCKSLQCLT